MKSSRKSRKSIRYSIFIGVLAGSVFSGSSAFAAVYTLSSISTMVADGDVTLVAGATYTAGLPTDEGFLVVDGSAYFDNFSGTFAGNGATITGLTVPLFNDLGGEVSELVLSTDSGGVSGNGVLANRVNMYTTIDEVQASGVVNGVSEYVGGLVGLAGWNSTISNSAFTGTVTAENNENYVGGLVGNSNGSIIGSNTSGGTIESTGSYVGGLVGFSSGQISESTSSMAVTSSGNYVGGLIGHTTGAVIDSSASGNVSSSGFGVVGGLIGYADGYSAEPVSITSSHATGAVDGSEQIGGLIGLASGTVTISDSYALGSVEGDTEVGGLVGYAGEASGNTAISDSYAAGAVVGNGNYIGGLVGYTAGGSITNSYATGNVTGSETSVGGLVGENGNTNISNSYSVGNISGDSKVGGLVGNVVNGDISNSYATGLISSTGDYLGGLVGYTNGAISNSFAQTTIESENSEYGGGLVGYTNGAISNSYARVVGNLEAQTWVGGLAGLTYGTISNSHANIGGDIIADGNFIGGLAGQAVGSISESYVSISSDLVGNSVTGGLAGYMQGNILNSTVYIGGNLQGNDYVGGLTGYLDQGNIENSDVRVGGNLSGNGYIGGLSGGFSNILEVTNIDDSDVSIGGTLSGLDRVGGLVGALYGGRTVSSYFSVGGILGENSDSDLFGYIDPSNSHLTTYTDPEKIWDIKQLSEFPSPLQTVNNGLTPGVFGLNSCLNQGIPYLIALSATLTSTCTSGRTPRLTRELGTRETLELRALNKIERISGFKNDTLLPKSAAISFVGPREEIDIAKVKAVEITPTANVKVRTKAGEALQISLKSESKESVELWVKSPDGTWLLAGVITFDKDGKAILPPLQFKGAGDYTLVLNKPSAGSAKGSEPLNQRGSLLVEVI